MGLFIGSYFSSVNQKFYNVNLIPFYILFFFILYKLSINLNPNEVFIRSRNYISFFLIITVLPYYFISLNQNKKFSIIPAFLTLILSFYSLGRSGILSSLILFIGILHGYKLKKFIKILLLHQFQS